MVAFYDTGEGVFLKIAQVEWVCGKMRRHISALFIGNESACFIWVGACEYHIVILYMDTIIIVIISILFCGEYT